MKRLPFDSCLSQPPPVGAAGALRALCRKCSALGEDWGRSAFGWVDSRLEQVVSAHTPAVSERKRRILDREFGIPGLRFQIPVEELPMARPEREISRLAWQKCALCSANSVGDCVDSPPNRPDRAAEWSNSARDSAVCGLKRWNLVIRREIPARKFPTSAVKSENLARRSANLRRERRNLAVDSAKFELGGEVFPLAPTSFLPAGAASSSDLRNRGPPEAVLARRS